MRIIRYFIGLCTKHLMKSMLILLCLAPIGESAISTNLTYQARLLTAAGNPVADGPYLIQFRIYDAAAGGAIKWNSNFREVLVSDALFSYPLGSIVPFPNNLFADNSELWLGVKVGTDDEMVPRTKITASGFAFQSLRSDSSDFSGNSMLLQGQTAQFYLDWNNIINMPAGFADGSDDVSGQAGGDLIGTYPNPQIATNAISTNEIIDGSITAADLANNSVGASEIVSGAVASSEIADGSIAMADIGQNGAGGGDVIQWTGSAWEPRPFAPLAFGHINSDGTISSGSGNIVSTLIAASNRYEISITGISYFGPSYVTLITPVAGAGGLGQMATTSSINGRLIVRIHDASGSPVQSAFQFVTFRP